MDTNNLIMLGFVAIIPAIFAARLLWRVASEMYEYRKPPSIGLILPAKIED